MPGKVAIDSNILIDLLGGDQTYEERIEAYEVVYLPVPVLGELIYGALISTSVDKNLEKISRIVAETRLISCDRQVAETYAQTKAILKRMEPPFPKRIYGLQHVA